MNLNLEESINAADQVRTLFEDMNDAGLKNTLVELADVIGVKTPWALVGGLAMGIHARPRGTVDIDIVVLSDKVIDDIERWSEGNFKKVRPYQLKSGSEIEIDILYQGFFKKNPLPPGLIESTIDSAVTYKIKGRDIPVADVKHFIVLKLYGGFGRDLGDIEDILKSKGEVIDIGEFNLPEKILKLYREICTGILPEE